MHFDNATLQVLRFVTQHALAHWVRLRNGQPLPLLTEFETDGWSHEVGQLSFCSGEIENDRPRYRVLREGSHVAAAYNSDWTGKYLDEVFPEHMNDGACHVRSLPGEP